MEQINLYKLFILYLKKVISYLEIKLISKYDMTFFDIIEEYIIIKK